jgi:hypothetical protein
VLLDFVSTDGGGAMNFRKTEDRRDPPLSLRSAIERVKKEEPLFSMERKIVVRDGGLGGRFFFLCILLVASLPIWEEVSKKFDQSNPLLTTPHMQGQLQAFAFVIVYAFALAISTVRALYKFRLRWADSVLQSVWLFPNHRLSTAQIVFSAMASYALSIWAFGLTYYYIFHAQFDPVPFSAPPHEGFFTWVYFSIVTMATVGYGEITPQTDWARAVVSAEIVMGVAYQVFFFSIVASLVRERAGRDLGV